MGTWDAGPFANDAAMDLVGETVDGLRAAVEAFLEAPEIDETFDAGFAAVALLNEIMQRTPARPWWDGTGPSGAEVRTAFLRCFDEQIDAMAPVPGFKEEQRAALVTELDRFVALVPKEVARSVTST